MSDRPQLSLAASESNRGNRGFLSSDFVLWSRCDVDRSHLVARFYEPRCLPNSDGLRRLPGRFQLRQRSDVAVRVPFTLGQTKVG